MIGKKAGDQSAARSARGLAHCKMTAPGQIATSLDVCVTAALPLEADIRLQSAI
jgi:hypothetical protein